MKPFHRSVKKSRQHIRVTFLLFTVAFAAFGLSLQARVSDGSGFKVTGTYHSAIPLKKETFKELERLTDSTVLRDAVGGEVQVQFADGGSSLRVSTTVQNESDLGSSHKFAVSLLSKNLKRSVVRQKNRTLRFLGASKSESIMTVAERSVVLKERIEQLETFLKDGTPPRSVPLSVDRSVVENAERNIQSSGQPDPENLARIADTKDQLANLEKELARVYLRAHKLEMDTLSSEENGVSQNEELELSRRAQDLTREINSLEQAPDLKLQGKLEFSQVSQTSQSILILCWAASLISFLFALFYSPPKPKPIRNPELSPGAPSPRPETQVLRVEWSDVMPGIVPRQGGDKAEAFFHEICTEMEHYLGRAPRRFLVLGDSPIESRLAFSLRLAHSLSNQAERVRLIDFDLTSRRLSKRLGRQNLPGVGDLLVDGGPVDEFFSSIAGTHIQFAPAGCTRLIEDTVDPRHVERILGASPGDMCVIDASSASPLHLVVRMIDVVLCTTQSTPGLARSQRETQVLVAFRDAGLPVWGVSAERNQFFPLL
jgi:hypothetical protein